MDGDEECKKGFVRSEGGEMALQGKGGGRGSRFLAIAASFRRLPEILKAMVIIFFVAFFLFNIMILLLR